MIRLMLLSVLVISGCLKTRSDVEEAENQVQIQSNMNRLQQSAADQEVKFQDIDAEFRNLSGRIEILEQRLRIESESEDEHQKTITGRLTKMEELMTLIQEALSEQETQLSAMQKELASMKKSPEKPQQKKVGNYTGAEQAFAKKQWKEAIIGYEKYLELNPTGRVAHMATYKIGVCFQELKMKDESRTFYQLAIDKFPGSEGAKRAAYRLKNMK